MKFLLLAITFLSLSAFGQHDEKSKPVLDKLSKDMKGMSSFYIEFEMNIKNSSNGTNDTQKGKGWVKGKKFNANLGDNIVISNGIKIWTVLKEDNTVMVSDADDDDEESINPKKLMTIWETGFKSKYVKETTIGSTPCHQINLYPTNPGDVEYHTIIMYVGKDKNDLKKVIMKTKDGTKMTYKLTKFTPNVQVSDSKFVFDKKKYPGIDIIED